MGSVAASESVCKLTENYKMFHVALLWEHCALKNLYDNPEEHICVHKAQSRAHGCLKDYVCCCR